MENQSLDELPFSRTLDYFLIILILTFFSLFFFMVSNSNINWDEYNYLSTIYDYQSGRKIAPIQSFHVHFFGWLTSISGGEIQQIFIARYFQLSLLLLSMLFLYLILRRYSNNTNALFSIILAISFTDIIRHGFSFRPDPICLFLFILSIYMLQKNNVFLSSCAGFIFAFSFLISIKTVFYLPTILFLFAISIYAAEYKSKFLINIIFYFIAAISSLIILYFFHNYLISKNSSIELTSSLIHGQEKIAQAGSKVFWTGRFFPRRIYIFRSITENFVTYFVILVGILISFKRLCSSKKNFIYAYILSFSLPFLTLAFYRNAFPYYFTFIIPPAILATIAYSEIEISFRNKANYKFCFFLITFPILIAIINSSYLIKTRLNDQLKSQHELINTVHRMFPDPVPYIDRNNMIASFPQAGFWMSTWGIESYRFTGTPIMRSILEKQQPKFLIANTNTLRINDERNFGENNSIYHLFDEDYIILKENFIHHWGALYVPGKTFVKFRKDSYQIFSIIIEGIYTVESDGDLLIDDNLIDSGGVLFLKKGQHTIQKIKANTVRLRFGDHLYRPEFYPSTQPIYVGL
jgi:hypothetical protein